MGNKLVEYVSELEVNLAKTEARKMLSEGVSQKDIHQLMLEGLNEIGKKYEAGECFIGDLIVSGMLMKDILSMDEMKTYNPNENKKFKGRILMGTVSDDIHDIGKDIMLEMFTAEGIEVMDLGVDVKPEKFVEAIQVFKPHIVGISCVLTTSINYIFETIKAIEMSGARESLKIIVGGAAINKKYYSIDHADAVTNDAYEGLHICENWLQEMDR
ncbi:MAG: cobalamin-binding protein [Eubacteriaceae bacterium]|nr:cobalamin-binding protein [Eubacteriaceae bacterium]